MCRASVYNACTTTIEGGWICDWRAVVGLQTLGFEVSRQKYSPHITLARNVITDSIPRPVAGFGETVSCISLMQSTRVNGKLTYSTMYSKESAHEILS